MPLCYALQGVVTELSFLAKPYQLNGCNDQMVLVDSLEGDKSDTPTTHGDPWHGLNHGPAHDHDYDHDHGHDSRGLSIHDSDLGPRHLMHSGYFNTT